MTPDDARAAVAFAEHELVLTLGNATPALALLQRVADGDRSTPRREVRKARETVATLVRVRQRTDRLRAAVLAMRANGTAERTIDRSRWYSLAHLRAVREEIRRECQVDPKFGSRLRDPRGRDGWLKSWREEHYPLTKLADHKHWPDDARFRWTPDAPADFEVEANGETFGIQCTTAYPVWPNAAGKSAGHTRALERQRVNAGAPAFGGGQPSRPTARDIRVDLHAWRDGIGAALKAKLDPKYDGLRLLIFAWRARFELVDFVFAEAVTPAVEAHEEAWRGIFHTIYVVDEDDDAFVEFTRG
jgi:hypothetical protein